jgi:hypothetical protein
MSSCYKANQDYNATGAGFLVDCLSSQKKGYNASVRIHSQPKGKRTIRLEKEKL